MSAQKPCRNGPILILIIFVGAIVIFIENSKSFKRNAGEEHEMLARDNRTAEMFFRLWAQKNFAKAASIIAARTQESLKTFAQENSGRDVADALAFLGPLFMPQASANSQIQCQTAMRILTAKKQPLGCGFEMIFKEKKQTKKYTTANTVLIGRVLTSQCMIGAGRRPTSN